MEPITDIGFRLSEAVAGFCGGVTYVFVTRNTDPYSAVGCVVAGTLTANYLSESVSHVTGVSGGGAAFITGLIAMALCQGIIAAAKKWRPDKVPK